VFAADAWAAHHQPGVIGRVAALFRVVRQDRREVEHLVDKLGDEPGQVVFGQPIIQRRRQQQQDLVRVERPEAFVHHRRTRLRSLRLDRFDLEQPIPTTHALIISYE
jgi:hypothetical protein